SVLQELSADELDEVADGFLAGPFGSPWSDEDLRCLVDEVLAAGSANGIGDPLGWSRDNVRRLLDPERTFLAPGTPHLDRAPELLRDLIRHGHAERGLRQELTDDALAAVDASAETFLAAVREVDEN
ncbi:MAG TPA: hypothetical protein VE781_05620, partial [Kineosporiaceae bacterium]|nr:hypothetical protein [Kineosporiaceae bacterium]